jgi:hypothetical protein
MAATLYLEIQCLVVRGVLDGEVEMAVKNQIQSDTVSL